MWIFEKLKLCLYITFVLLYLQEDGRKQYVYIYIILPMLLFDNAHSGDDPDDKINRKHIIAMLRNACSEAGFEPLVEDGRKQYIYI
jgi:hypothetical protein